MRRTLTLLRLMMHVANDPYEFHSVHDRAAGAGLAILGCGTYPSSSRRLVTGKSPTMPPPSSAPPPRPPCRRLVRRLVVAGDVPRQVPSISQSSARQSSADECDTYCYIR